MPILVLISCMYSVGCSETSQTYLQSDTQLQESLKYAESLVNKNMNQTVLTYSGILLTAASGSSFKTALTSHVNLEGSIKWQTGGLNYHYSF